MLASLSLLSEIIAQCRAGTVGPAARPRLASVVSCAAVSSSPPPPSPPQPPPPSFAPPAVHLKFVDIGANLLDGMFQGDYRGKLVHPPDIDAVLSRAADAGVERAIVTAGSLDESRQALEFVRTRRAAGSRVALYSTVGVHPTRSLEFLPAAERAEVERAMRAVGDGGEPGAEDLLAELEAEALSRPHVVAALESHVAALRDVLRRGVEEGVVVALGETGLDYDRLHFCPAGVQRAGFEAQLRLAGEAGLPLFLHNRNTGGDFFETCARHAAQISRGGVVHSFDGDAAELDQLVGLGLHIGLNGCSLRTADNLDVAARVPADRVHLETDAPWCSIKRTHAGYSHVRPLVDPHSGGPYEELKKEKWRDGATVKDRAEPCHIVHVLQVVAGARRDAGSGDAAHADAAAAELSLAAAAYRNSMAMFWPEEASS